MIMNRFSDGFREAGIEWIAASILLLSLVLCLWFPGPANAGEQPPNFIVFLMDDVGYADMGVQGAEGFRTPNFDRLAAEGTRLTDFYVHPVCGVTRAALMTGCYAMRVGEVKNTKHGHPILHPEEITLAEVLKTRGYATGLVGKWHLGGPGGDGFSPELMPNAQGFDFHFGTPTHNGFTRTIEGSPFRARLVRNGETVDESIDQDEMDQLTRRYTEESIDFIRRNKDRPFFLYLAHNMAHVVLGASERFRGTSDRGLYGDVMQELDWSAGEVVRTLQELGLDERTLIVFTSDNGPWEESQLAGPTPQEDHYGRATPLRGFKMTTWEGGVRAACIARWPGKIPPRRVCHEPATIMDLLPTFAAMSGAELPKERKLDGRDISPLLLGEPEAGSPHEAIYHYAFTHLQAVRCGKWKLVLPRPAKPPWCSWSARMIDGVPEPQLYDLENDVGEQQDVSAQNPEILQRLLQLAERGREDLGDYDRVGTGQRFFDQGPKRPESARWIDGIPLPKTTGRPLSFRHEDVTGIGSQDGVCRRDPSDVVWNVTRATGLQAVGYDNAHLWAACGLTSKRATPRVGR